MSHSGSSSACSLRAYTINDGWAVKALMISPFIVDWTGNVLRIVLLAPMALKGPLSWRGSCAEYRTSILVVSVLGPLGYILGVVRDEDRAHRGTLHLRASSRRWLEAYFGVKLLKERPDAATSARARVLIVGGWDQAWR